MYQAWIGLPDVFLLYFRDHQSANGIEALLVQARRGVLGGLIGAAALLSFPKDASAAFGDAARVCSEPR
jgi:hypothetical protein